MKRIKLSIIIPTYNREKYIEECIQTAAMQCNYDNEIIVVDDGSTDNTIRILENSAIKVKILRQKHLGACAARNYGLQNAVGEYITFLDSDDYYIKDMLGEMIYSTDSNDSDIIFGRHILSSVIESGPVRILQPTDSVETVFRKAADGRVVQTGAVCWKRDFINKIGGWAREVAQWQDVELYMRAMTYQPNIRITENSGLIIREHAGKERISHNVNQDTLSLQIQFAQEIEKKAINTKFSPLVGRLYYRIARHAFRHGLNNQGKVSLRHARRLGTKNHIGSIKHVIFSSIFGLELKEKISIKIKSIPY